MIIKVLFTNPPVTVKEEDYFEGMSFMPPLGLAYLAAVASAAGHEAAIVDCVGMSPMKVEKGQGVCRCGLGDTEILEEVRHFAPDLVGITCPYTANAPDALSVAELVKTGYSDEVPVVMGGAHASVCPEELLMSGWVDFVVVGEGEGAFIDICSSLAAGRVPLDVPGVLGRGPDGQVTSLLARERIKDLDAIPYPRRDLIPLREYFKAQEAHAERINNMRRPKTSMITSRGCPENCVFCAIRCTWGRKWVGRSPLNIVGEIESLVSEYGVREIDFLDDSLSVSRARLEELCKLIIERGLDIKWTTPNGIAIWSLDEKLLLLMKKAGCYRLTFGLESGDPETIKFIRKRYTNDQAMRLIRYSNRIGLWTIGTFILGFPYETREQMQNTIEFAMKCGVDLAVFYCATPFPGTDLYQVCLDEGIEVPRASSLMLSSVGSVNLDEGEIARVREEANSRFVANMVKRPWKPLSKIRNLEDLRYVIRVVGFGWNLRRKSAKDRSTTSFLYSSEE